MEPLTRHFPAGMKFMLPLTLAFARRPATDWSVLPRHVSTRDACISNRHALVCSAVWLSLAECERPHPAALVAKRLAKDDVAQGAADDAASDAESGSSASSSDDSASVVDYGDVMQLAAKADAARRHDTRPYEAFPAAERPDWWWAVELDAVRTFAVMVEREHLNDTVGNDAVVRVSASRHR
jgi:hypothetical protein